MENTPSPTRCAFIVCKVLKCGKPHLLLVRDTVWGDLTLVGGHEEPGDSCNLELTARREVEEELGRLMSRFVSSLSQMRSRLGRRGLSLQK